MSYDAKTPPPPRLVRGTYFYDWRKGVFWIERVYERKDDKGRLEMTTMDRVGTDWQVVGSWIRMVWITARALFRPIDGEKTIAQHGQQQP